MIVERIVDGIPVNPVTPRAFWSRMTGQRPRKHIPWWGLPFVVATRDRRWPEGMRYETYCLDGDQPSVWGAFRTLEEALRCAKEGPAWTGDPTQGDGLPAQGSVFRFHRKSLLMVRSR